MLFLPSIFAHSLSPLSEGPFVEELFEVTSCYFPVDFTPVSESAMCHSLCFISFWCFLRGLCPLQEWDETVAKGLGWAGFSCELWYPG